jgi:hypothetical protein
MLIHFHCIIRFNVADQDNYGIKSKRIKCISIFLFSTYFEKLKVLGFGMWNVKSLYREGSPRIVMTKKSRIKNII